MRRRDLLLSSAGLMLGASAAHAQAPARADIESALTSVGRYAAEVLITLEGKGRADYDLVTGQWREYEPHWHTGQQILGLLQAWRITREPALLEAARRGGDWWISTEFQHPHPLAGLVNAYHGDHVGPLINFTTISDGTAGLFALSRATGDARYADCATRSGAWLYANTRVQSGDQLFYNMIDPATGRVVTDYSPHHRGIATPTITQLARPNIEGSLFLDMHRHTGRRIWRERFIEQAQGTLRWQRENGLWMDFEPNDPATGQVHPRFNIWNAEAMLEAYQVTRDARFLDGALRTGRFMARVQDRRGAIYYDIKDDGTWTLASITGSAVAFAGMLWMRLRAHGVGDEFTPNIERALAWVLANRFADNHPDPNLRGAVLETRVRVAEGRTRVLIRDIASAFGLRFLAMAHDERAGLNINEHRP